MNYRSFGRVGWQVSEIGYGMWGMGGWTGSDDAESLASLQRAVEAGVNFFDTAFVYGDGRSENLLGEVVRANPNKKIYTATKIPPKNGKFPALGEYSLDDCYPPEHIEEYVYKSLKNVDLESFDLVQLHTWNDRWTDDDRWFDKLNSLREQKLLSAIGISLNRWEPWNGVRAVQSGKVDAVQVIYNIFDQNPEDELFPACAAANVAVIARVPFDEGTLTGTLTKDTTFPADDWRNTFFKPENLIPSVERADALKPLVLSNSTMAEMALRFILSNKTVSTIIPGMRKIKNVDANVRASAAGALPADLLAELRKHRWVRKLAPKFD